MALENQKVNPMASKQIDITKKYPEAEARIQEIKSTLQARMVRFFAEDGHHPVLDDFFQTAGKIMLSGEAKRLRCIIPVLVADESKLPEKDCFNSGIIVEMLHYSSLIHDDVIDQDQYRRGSETLNNDSSNSQAVLIGDYILCMALSMCLKFTHNQQVIDLVVKTVKDLITGIIIEQKELPKGRTLLQYRNMAELKTGSLFSLSFGLPFAGESRLEDGLNCGASFGVMYQIYDDFLDRTEDDPGINSFSLFPLSEVISLWNEMAETFVEGMKEMGLTQTAEIIIGHLRSLGYFKEVETEDGVLFHIPAI